MQLLKHFHELTLPPQNAKELKGLILQLAVQGKLTAQWRLENPDIEPASILLERINAEKAQLIAEKKIRKEKPLPLIMENELAYEIPNTWVMTRLGEIGDWGAGATPLRSNPEYYGGTINWYKSGELNNDLMDYDSNEKITELALSKSSLRLNKPGDVLIAMYGATIGKTGMLKYQGTTNQAVCACTCFKGINNQFLHLLLKALRNDFLNQGEGGAQPNISRVKIRLKVINLPPLPEQKAIVQIVNQLFQKIEQLEQLTEQRIQLKTDFATSALHQLTNGDTAAAWTFLKDHFHIFFTEVDNIKKLRESILQLAVQGKLTKKWRLANPDVEPASILLERIKAEKARLIKEKKIRKEKPLPPITPEEIPYELPDGWVWCRMEDIMSIKSGVTKGKRYKSEVISSPYLRVANVQRGFLNLDIIKEILVSVEDYEKYQLEAKDLLMIEGGDPDKLGRCAIWNNEIQGCIYQNHVFRVRPFIRSSVNEQFFMRFINSPITRNYYENCAKRTTNLASINKTQMRSTPIAFPPLQEQNAIVEKIEELFVMIELLGRELNLKENSISLIMKAVLREVFEPKKKIER